LPGGAAPGMVPVHIVRPTGDRMDLFLPAACLALALGLALIYGARFAVLPVSGAKSAVKVLSVALLLPFGMLLGAPTMVLMGLALGALGDFLLSRPGERAFLAGMGAFGLGHLAYAAQFWGLGGGALPLLLALPLIALALSTELWLAPKTGALRWPVRAYVVIITAMALAALTLPQGFGVTLAGALLFVLSDALLALDLFVLPPGARARPLIQRSLWAAYWCGQALILIGLLPARPA
jgi:uncharacterized membrane protein YhhN